MPDLIFRQGDPLPGFPEHRPVFPIRASCLVKALLKGTFLQLRTSIADIRGPGKPAAFFFYEVRADCRAFLTGSAVTVTGAGGADPPVVTSAPAGAVVERPVGGPCFFINFMGAHFLGDSRTVPAKTGSDCFKRIPVI